MQPKTVSVNRSEDGAVEKSVSGSEIKKRIKQETHHFPVSY